MGGRRIAPAGVALGSAHAEAWIGQKSTDFWPI
jgi:hypothetical protein